MTTETDSEEVDNQETQVEVLNDQSTEVERESIQEEPAKMGRTITAVVKFLRTKKRKISSEF